LVMSFSFTESSRLHSFSASTRAAIRAASFFASLDSWKKKDSWETV
jgi:hypothetical protein